MIDFEPWAGDSALIAVENATNNALISNEKIASSAIDSNQATASEAMGLVGTVAGWALDGVAGSAFSALSLVDKVVAETRIERDKSLEAINENLKNTLDFGERVASADGGETERMLKIGAAAALGLGLVMIIGKKVG